MQLDQLIDEFRQLLAARGTAQVTRGRLRYRAGTTRAEPLPTDRLGLVRTTEWLFSRKPQVEDVAIQKATFQITRQRHPTQQAFKLSMGIPREFGTASWTMERIHRQSPSNQSRNRFSNRIAAQCIERTARAHHPVAKVLNGVRSSSLNARSIASGSRSMTQRWMRAGPSCRRRRRSHSRTVRARNP